MASQKFLWVFGGFVRFSLFVCVNLKFVFSEGESVYINDDADYAVNSPLAFSERLGQCGGSEVGGVICIIIRRYSIMVVWRR